MAEQLSKDEQENQASMTMSERQAKEMEHLRKVADARLNVAYDYYVKMQKYKRFYESVIRLNEAWITFTSREEEEEEEEEEEAMTFWGKEALKECESRYNLEFGNANANANANAPPNFDLF